MSPKKNSKSKMSARALATQEREMQVQRLTKISRSLLLLIATIMSLSTVVLLMADQLYRPESFVIDHLKIKGKFRYSQPKDVEAVVQEEDLGNFFSIDLSDIKKRIESLAWIRNADVRREWPNTLSIDVIEHRPLMPWSNNLKQDEKSNYWLTSLGDVINLPNKIDLTNNIVLVGNHRDSQLDLQQTYHWKKMTEVHGLTLKKVILSDSHAWQLRLSYLDNDFDVLLGRIDVEDRLSRFLFLFDNQFKGNDKKLARVDARYPNGLAVKVKEVSEEEQLAMMNFQDKPLAIEQSSR